MKVLIVSQYFWPEYFRVNDLAIELSKKNIKVDILTGYPNYPGGVVYKEFNENKKKFSKLGDINIFRVPIFPRKSGNKFWLTINYLSFVFAGLLYGTFLVRKKKYDHIITFATSPIIVALVSIFISKLKKAKHTIWVLDLWPDVLIDLNIIKKNTAIHNFFKFIVKTIYKNSDIILCQSLSFIKEIKSLSKNFSSKIYFFPSWPEEVSSNLYNKNGIKYIYDKNFINILFAGNIGESQNFELVMKVMKFLKNIKIKLHILGEGRSYEWLKDYKTKNKLDNVYIYGLKKFDEMQSFFFEADYLLISLKYQKTFNSTIPGKFQTYLKYKKPILGFIGGETNSIINKYKIGKAFDYTDDSTFLKEVENFFLDASKPNYSSYEKLLNLYSKNNSLKKLERLLLNFIYIKKIKLVSYFKNVNLNKNFIISGLNLAFLGYLSKGDIVLNKAMVLWPDGYFRRRFHLQNINKIPGRDFLKNIQLENSSIIKVYVFGNLENESMKYLQNKFVNQEIVNIKLPYGNLEDFKSHIPIFKENEICLSTLPTPKQEILANYILSSQKYCKFICLGGAVNMAAGLEKPLPDIFKNIFFAETLWRLQFETKRRSIRLLESFYYYFVGEIFRKYQKIEIINEVDEKY